MEWKSNHTIADHATSMQCEECHGANLLSARTQFTTKITQRKTEGAPRPEPTPVPQQRPTARVAPASGTALQMQDELDIEMRFILNKDTRTAIEIPT